MIAVSPSEERNEVVFSTIVVGTDGSPDAEDALRAAAELARMNPDTKVHVVGAFQPIPPSELRSIADSLPDEFRSLVHGTMQVDSTLDVARSVMKLAGVEADYHEIIGHPADAIIDAAEDHDADLIMVGSRGEGATKRLLHGSVSTNVVHHAPCAVLVVRKDH